MYGWLILLHVFAVFGFLMAHGVSMSVAFALRRERNPERIRTLLDHSGNSIGILYISILILLLTGVIGGFMGRWWGRGWIWAALFLLIAMLAFMSIYGSGYYGQVRKAIGQGYMENFKPHPPVQPASSEMIDKLLRRSHPILLAVVGFGGLAIITWLMKFKPF